MSQPESDIVFAGTGREIETRPDAEATHSSVTLRLLNNIVNSVLETTPFIWEGIRSIRPEKAEEISRENELLRLEVERQTIATKAAENQARIAQEIAIARRIETSEEVELIEYFDCAGEGNAGLKADVKLLSVGIGAQGRYVTKREFRFRGKISSRRKETRQNDQ